MNVYATGMNSADCNALQRSPRVAIFQAFPQIIKSLQFRGHKVTWKKTKVGDVLPPETDAVIVSMLLPRSLNSPYALGTMWAISEAINKQIPLVLYMTDWAFFKAAPEYKSIAKAGVPYFSKMIGGRLQYNENPDMINKYGERLLGVCSWYGDPNSVLWEQAQVLIPKYTNWGNSSIIQGHLLGANPVLPFDPTPAFCDYINLSGIASETMSVDREKQWLWPSLLNDDRWLQKQRLKWPIIHYGPKGFPVAETERDIQKLYQQSIGAICPPYPTEGSGWWRSRWIHSALAGSVLICGNLDWTQAGDAYVRPGELIETLPDEKLREIAQSQRDRMWKILQFDPLTMHDQAEAPFKKAGAIFRY